MHLGDGHAVIGDGHPGSHGPLHPGLHLPVVEHTAAAVDGQRDAVKVLRKFAAGSEAELQVFFAGVAVDPRRQLHRADILALAMMGAALGDQHRIAIPQVIQRRRAPHHLFQLALVAGEKDGEGGQGNVLGHVPADRPEGLRVGDDQPGLPAQRRQRGLKLRNLYHHVQGVMIQNVPDGLLLGQDQPTLGRGGVYRRDQNDDILRLQQIAHDDPLIFRLAHHGGNGFLQFVNVVAPLGADVELVLPGGGKLPQQVAFVQGDQVGYLPLLKQLQQGFVLGLQAAHRVHHQYGDVGLGQHLPGSMHPHFAQFALVVHAGSVDDDHRPQRQQLHGLLHRVGGGALYVGDQRKVLPRHGVHHAGFARVP